MSYCEGSDGIRSCCGQVQLRQSHYGCVQLISPGKWSPAVPAKVAQSQHRVELRYISAGVNYHVSKGWINRHTVNAIKEGGSFKYRYFQKENPFVFIPPFVAQLAVVRGQEECNCPNRMAWCLFLPLDACPTLYRCTSTFSASTAQLFLCMAGITTMCSIKSPTCPTQTATRHRNHPPKPLLLLHVLQLQGCFRIMARELLFTTHFPLSGDACAPRGKVNPPTVKAKEMREEEGTADFMFNSHKKLLPPGSRHHHLFFSSFSPNKNLPAWLYSCSLKRLWPDRALHPVIPKTLPSISLALFFSGLLFSGLINPEITSEGGFSCQQVIHRMESRRKRGSDRGHIEAAMPQFLEGWVDHRHLWKRSLLLVLTLSTQGLFFPIRNNARKVQGQVKIAFSAQGCSTKKP